LRRAYPAYPYHPGVLISNRAAIGAGRLLHWRQLVIRYAVLHQRAYGTRSIAMLLEILRIAAAFGLAGIFIAFWYWFMDSTGTF
jgi:hypothetical protein